MKIELAPNYPNWMLLLLPTTLGLGTAALWLMSLKWPLRIDEEGLTLRDRRRIGWHSIRKISISRNYLDGRVSRIRIYHESGLARIRTDRLQHGQDVARIVLAMFAHFNRIRDTQRQARAPSGESDANHARPTVAAEQQAAAAEAKSSRAQVDPQVDTWVREFSMLEKTGTD